MSDLACVHCRASAQAERQLGELTTEEGCELLSEVKPFGNALVVLTGGDPRKRPDLCELLPHSLVTGLRTNVTAPRPVDRRSMRNIPHAIRLDGSDATHDGLRDIGQETQVQTTVMQRNLSKLGHLAESVAEA